MRYIYTLTIFYIITNFLIAQPLYNDNGGASGKDNLYSNEKNIIINLHGGILQAAEIIKGDDNSYWIKKGQYTNKSNTVVIEFNEKLYLNKKPVVEQVNAKYGYLVFFSETYDYALVYIVDKNGNLNSDELYIQLK